jgi:hypothetical protein
MKIKQEEQGRELMNTLIKKAWKSSEFKEQLIENPTKTIEDLTNQKFTLPEGKSLIVEDQTSESHIYINIPAKPDFDELELSDEQLEMVSGGILIVAATVIGVGLAVWAFSDSE